MRWCFTGLLIFLCFLTASCTGRDPEGVRIGIITSLNGPAGEQGKNWLRGAELAALDLNNEGNAVSLFIEDDQTEAKKVVSAFSKLVEVHSVQAVIGGTWDYLGEAAYPLAVRYRIPFVTPTNPCEVISPAARNSEYIFSNGMTLAATKEAMRSFFSQKKPGAVGLVYPNLPFGTEQAALVKDLAHEMGFAISFEYPFPIAGLVSDAMQFAHLKLQKSKPDVTFAVLDYNYLDLLTKQFKAHQSYPTMLVTQHLDKALVFSQDPERYRSMYAVYPEVYNEHFARKYQEAHDEQPPVYAAHGYDAVMFLVKMLETKAAAQGNAFHLRYAGITGEHRLPAPEGCLVQNRAVIMTAKNGIFEENR